MKTQFKRLFYFALFACLFLSCHNLSFFYQHIDCINLKFDAFCFASSVSLENNWSKFNLEIIRLFLFSVNCSNCYNRNVLNSVQMRSYWLHGKFFSLNLRKKNVYKNRKISFSSLQTNIFWLLQLHTVYLKRFQFVQLSAEIIEKIAI